MALRFECPRCQHVFVSDEAKDQAFADCPACGALALFAGEATYAEENPLARMASRQSADQDTCEGRPLRDVPSSVSLPSMPPCASGRGVFEGLLAEDPEHPLSADPTHEDLDLPVAAPRPVTAEGATAPNEPAPGPSDGAATAPNPTAPGPSEEGATKEAMPSGEHDAFEPAFTSQEIAPSPVLLSSLEADVQGMPLLGGALGEEAFDELERAFDEVARRPDPEPALPSRAEDALRQASLHAAHSGFALPTAPEEVAAAVPAPLPKQEPPALRRARPRTLHLTLSEEAKALAGIPLRRKDDTEQTARLPRARAAAPGDDCGLDEHAEITEPRGRAQRGVPSTKPKPLGARKEEAPKVPAVFAGFTLARVAAAAAVFLVVGGLVGAAVAPEPERKPATPRARAEQRFAEGNRFYEKGRFDDALGSYRGAIALDRTFAPAYRAKAAALAKQKRHEEAAQAYRAYLDIAPDAVDAEAVREVLARYEGEGP